MILLTDALTEASGALYDSDRRLLRLYYDGLEIICMNVTPMEAIRATRLHLKEIRRHHRS